MTTDTTSDERKTYAAVQTIIDALIEFDKDTRARMLRTVSTFFNIEAAPESGLKQPLSSVRDVSVPPFANRKDLAPKDFLIQKKPRTDVERVACLAFYLTHFRNIAHFKTTDISKLNTEAAQLKFSNASNTVNNAVRSGFLVPALKGAKQLSAPGEKFVDHLPDYATAKKVMLELTPRKKRRPGSKNAKSLKASVGAIENE